jgi:Short C-terminal domain
MLFLYRPRQTWMPFRPPRTRTDQDGYNLRMQQAYSATRRVEPYTPAASEPAAEDPVARLRELARLHESGALSDAEFAAAKAKILGLGGTTT